PAPFPSSKTGAEFQSCIVLRAAARGERRLARSSPAPGLNWAGVASTARIVELFYFGRGECAVVDADVSSKPLKKLAPTTRVPRAIAPFAFLNAVIVPSLAVSA